MRLTIFPLFFASVIATLSLSARTWTDSEQRTMEAELVRVDGKEAVFQKPSGLRYRFPIAKLSVADQNYISESQQADTSRSATAQTQQAETDQMARKKAGRTRR